MVEEDETFTSVRIGLNNDSDESRTEITPISALEMIEELSNKH